MDEQSVPPYAILSHTWATNEVTFAHLQENPDLLLEEDPAERQPSKDVPWTGKVRNTCLQAAERGFRYVWVDTCCINKHSDSEVSEAINSMYR